MPVHDQRAGDREGGASMIRVSETTRGSWAVVKPYARNRRWTIALLGGLLLALTVLQVLNPQVVRLYIDQVTTGAAISILMWAAVVYLVIALLVQGVRVVAAYFGENVAWGMTNDLRAELMRHCLDLDYEFHKDHTPGELIERVDGDVTTLAKFLSSAFLVILSNVLLILGIFVSLFFTEWRIGLVLLGYALVAVVVLLGVRGVALGAWARVREISASLFGFLGERLSSTEDIRSSRAEGFVLSRLADLNGRMLRAQRTAHLRSEYIFLSMHGLYLFGYGGALAVGGLLYLNGVATLGTVYLVIAYTAFIYMPLNEVRSQIQQMQQAVAGMRRVLELLAVRRKVVDGPGVVLPDGPFSVELRDVSFSYQQGGPWALREVSLSLAAGEVLGLMGRTGSGKSTLARLIARMYDPTAGAVLLGGQPLADARLADIRGRIGLVTQDVQLFHGTVRDNVTLFDDTIGRERIEAAMARLGLGEWLRRLPDGIATPLESGQATVSAGEAQLLAICRVFLRDPSLVILDEVSSRLDLETEHLLERALTELLADRTGVVIAHRVSTVRRADRVVFLDGGRVSESGSRAALAADPRSQLSQLIASADAGVIP
jgi:ATP-binding cassette subfamily B protein